MRSGTLYSSRTNGLRTRQRYEDERTRHWTAGGRDQRFSNSGGYRQRRQQKFKNLPAQDRIKLLLIKFGEKEPFKIDLRSIEGLSTVLIRDLKNDGKNVWSIVTNTLTECIQAFPLRLVAYALLLKMLRKKYKEDEVSDSSRNKNGSSNENSMEVDVDQPDHQDIVPRILSCLTDNVISTLKNLDNDSADVLCIHERLKLTFTFFVHCCNIGLVSLSSLTSFFSNVLNEFTCAAIMHSALFFEKACMNSTDSEKENIESFGHSIEKIVSSLLENTNDLDDIVRESVFKDKAFLKVSSVYSSSTAESLSVKELSELVQLNRVLQQRLEILRESNDSEVSSDSSLFSRLWYENPYFDSSTSTVESNKLHLSDTGVESTVITKSCLSVLRNPEFSVLLSGNCFYVEKVRRGRSESELPLQGLEKTVRTMDSVILFEKFQINSLVDSLFILYGKEVEQIAFSCMHMIKVSTNPTGVLSIIFEHLINIAYDERYRMIHGTGHLFGVLTHISKIAARASFFARVTKHDEDFSFLGILDDWMDSFVLQVPLFKSHFIDFGARIVSFLYSTIYLHSNVNYTQTKSPECINSVKFSWAKWETILSASEQEYLEKPKLAARRQFLINLLSRIISDCYPEYVFNLLPEKFHKAIELPIVCDKSFEGDELKLFEKLKVIARNKGDMNTTSEIESLEGQSVGDFLKILIETTFVVGKASFTHLRTVLRRLSKVYESAKERYESTSNSETFALEVVNHIHRFCSVEHKDFLRSVVAYQYLLWDMKILGSENVYSIVLDSLSESYVYRDFVQESLYYFKEASSTSDIICIKKLLEESNDVHCANLLHRNKLMFNDVEKASRQG